MKIVSNDLVLLILSPSTWIAIVATILLLFGSSVVPRIARLIGSSKRAWKSGLSGHTEVTRRSGDKL